MKNIIKEDYKEIRKQLRGSDEVYLSLLPGSRPVFTVVRERGFGIKPLTLDTSKIRCSIVVSNEGQSPSVEITDFSLNLLKENLDVLGILLTDEYLEEVKPSILLNRSRLIDFDEVDTNIYEFMNTDGESVYLKASNERIAETILSDLEKIRSFVVE